MTLSCILALEENPEDIYLETTTVLLKLVDNVINNPANPKYRTIRLGNPTIANKILPAVGAMECLFEMGFQEGDDSLVLPDTISMENLRHIRNQLTTRRSLYKKVQENPGKSSASPHQNSSPSQTSTSNSRPNPVQSQKQQKRPQKKFLENIASHFQAVLRYEDKDLQSKALRLIPLGELELGAEKNMRKLQRIIKRGQTAHPEVDTQELILVELLSWFKNSFFTWVDSPSCMHCEGSTKFIGHTVGSQEGEAQRTEIFSCNICQGKTLFPRYNDPEKLLETRRGRCGEWANCFTLMCRALGWETRYIADETDHVWTEVYSGIQKKWLHCDPCENVYDSPLMYEVGWGKKLTYVMAYSRDEVQDVTWRYSCKHREVLSRRTECSERELLETLMKLRQERQKHLSDVRKLYLNKRLLAELVEFLAPRQPTEAERKGRSSGSLTWRLARGEIEDDRTPFIWRPTKYEIDARMMHIQYSASRNKYIRNVGKEEIAGWENGVFQVKSVFRKEEKDWKMVYLARQEGSDEGTISLKFDMANSDMVIESVQLLCSTWLQGKGSVLVKLCGSDMCTLVPGGNQIFETTAFRDCAQLELTIQLRGGEGDCAWQHAQLFRQDITNVDYYPLDIIIRLKKSS